MKNLENVENIDWENIEKFLGYGAIDAPVVFIGLEEGADRCIDKLVHDLLGRSSGACFGEIKSGEFNTVKTWRVMCDFMLRFEGAIQTDINTRKIYQNTKLGRSSQANFLTELMPYPSPGLDCWPYGILGKDKDRETYKKRLWPSRRQLIYDFLVSHRRRFIICYGKKDRNLFKELFPEDLNWETVGNLELANWNGQRVAITPHFVSRSFNTNEQMAALFNTMNA